MRLSRAVIFALVVFFTTLYARAAAKSKKQPSATMTAHARAARAAHHTYPHSAVKADDLTRSKRVAAVELRAISSTPAVSSLPVIPSARATLP